MECNNNVVEGSLEQVQESVEYVKSKIGNMVPQLGIICGSGLGPIADQIEDPICLDYNEIPHLQKIGPGVQGHAGKLIVGTFVGRIVVAMKGRFHPYEGYKSWKVGLPVRIMKLLGCSGVVITNAAGGLNESFSVGDFMIIQDHLYIPGLAGFSPLVGPNDDRIGPRFPPMGDAYNKEWRNIAKNVATDIGENIKSGTYCCVFGPNFESPAEANMLKVLGGDAVGMSTVHEVVAARHCGMKVLAISMITNKVKLSIDQSDQANHAEVLETSETRSVDFIKMMTNIIKKL